MADALHRDLLTDRLTFDELGWRGLWAYITKAPPGTAIYQHRTEGWALSDKLSAELLDDMRELLWRYGAVHFQDYAKTTQFPIRIDYPGAPKGPQVIDAKSWESVTLDEMVSPEVRALLQA